MTVTADTTIHDLIGEYPYLLDWLVAYDSHFSALKNPALFKTMARVAKVETAAAMAGVDTKKLLDDIRTEIARREIAAEESADAPAAPVDPEVAASRQEALKGIIRKLHDGVPVEQVKAEFDALIVGIDSAEIARMEQALIAEGMPVEDVQRLCDVHVTVFKEALDEKPSATVEAGHPIDAYKRENEVATQLVADLNLLLGALATATDDADRAAVLETISAKLGELATIDTHYARKENQLFPVLETHGVEGPTKVMWALDDDIRGRLKTARSLLAAGDTVIARRHAARDPHDDRRHDLQGGEDPLPHLARRRHRRGMGDGSPPATPRSATRGSRVRQAKRRSLHLLRPPPKPLASGEMLLPLPTGALTLGQLDLLFRALPFDVTYVDENDRVRFYSEGERVFPRSPGAIGREVRNCHPPKSLHKVEEILAAFKAAEKDVAEFWIEMGPKFIHIRYFALRDEGGAYRGCLEVVHDATHVRGLIGNRRIVDW